MNIIFVHLGPSANKHLVPNIQRFQRLFPEHDIHLVTSDQTSLNEIPEYIQRHTYNSDSRVEKLLESLTKDSKFREGFWRYSIERILAIKVVHEKYPSSPIIHFESDILVMPNFPFEEIERSVSLMWNMYNSSHDVSAILFSPNIDETIKLRDAILAKIDHNPDITDMTALNEIWRNGEIVVNHFETLCKELPEMKNNLAEAFPGSDKGIGFGGIFDGAAIGMWLLGHDPKNNYGKSIIHNDSVIVNGNSFIDPRAIDYELTEKGELYAISKKIPSRRIPIWNLHAHCKNSTLLSQEWEPELRKYIEFAKSGDRITVMDWSVLRDMFVTSLKNRTFLGFVLGIPQLQRIRRKLAPFKKLIKKS